MQLHFCFPPRSPLVLTSRDCSSGLLTVGHVALPINHVGNVAAQEGTAEEHIAMLEHQKEYVLLELLCLESKGEGMMVERRLTLAEIMLIAGTRVALGIGIGLLLSNKLGHSERKAAGLALTLAGALTTVPLALNVLGKKDVVPTSEIRPAI